MASEETLLDHGQLWLNISRNSLLVFWDRHSVGTSHRGPVAADGPAARLTSARAPGRVFTGVGHNPLQEVAQAFTQAVVDGF
jgi:hypothetical protein